MYFILIIQLLNLFLCSIDVQVQVIEYCLVQPLLKFKNTSNMVYVNFDSRLSLLILESSCMMKMELPVPIVTKALFFRKDHFTLVCDTLQVSKMLMKINNNGY